MHGGGEARREGQRRYAGWDASGQHDVVAQRKMPAVVGAIRLPLTLLPVRVVWVATVVRETSAKVIRTPLTRRRIKASHICRHLHKLGLSPFIIRSALKLRHLESSEGPDAGSSANSERRYELPDPVRSYSMALLFRQSSMKLSYAAALA